MRVRMSKRMPVTDLTKICTAGEITERVSHHLSAKHAPVTVCMRCAYAKWITERPSPFCVHVYPCKRLDAIRAHERFPDQVQSRFCSQRSPLLGRCCVRIVLAAEAHRSWRLAYDLPLRLVTERLMTRSLLGVALSSRQLAATSERSSTHAASATRRSATSSPGQCGWE